MTMSTPAIAYVALVTLASLAVYIWTFSKVGQMRGKHKIAAPAMTGHPEFERAVRVQANTLEQLVPFLVALWLAALYLHPLGAALIGLVWVIGRVMYALAYWQDAAKRGRGFTLSSIATVLLLLGALVGIVLALVR